MSKDNEIELPSVLAFERKLEISDGLMYAGDWDNRNKLTEEKDKKIINLWQPIAITKRFNRATQSAQGIKDVDKTKPNPVASGDDKAVIPSGCDTLKVSWTLRVMGKVGTPFSCNGNDFEEKIKNRTKDFKKQKAFEDLSYRYAYNIVNGRFLWRNRVCAESVEIQVNLKDEGSLFFDAYQFSLHDFDKNKKNANLNQIADVIREGLIDETGEKFTSIRVNAFVKLDELQQIFPSQEMNMNEKGKVLFQLNNVAALHNVKIGNAIRTIDTWYGSNAIDKDKTEKLEHGETTPIAIEPYGSVTQRGIAFRSSKNDLYTLIINWVSGKEIDDNDKNYVIANLIRGGVFSGSSK